MFRPTARRRRSAAIYALVIVSCLKLRAEIIKAATEHDAGPIVVAAGGRGLGDVILVGSTAQRVQHYAPCPVLVVRPAPRPRKATRRQA